MPFIVVYDSLEKQSMGQKDRYKNTYPIVNIKLEINGEKKF